MQQILVSLANGQTIRIVDSKPQDNPKEKKYPLMVKKPEPKHPKNKTKRRN